MPAGGGASGVMTLGLRDQILFCKKMSTQDTVCLTSVGCKRDLPCFYINDK